MKKTLTLILALLPLVTFAQKATELKYVDAKELMVINQGFDNTEDFYTRLPADMKDVTRKEVWDLGLNSAGLAVRFSTDSKCIGAQWTLLNNFGMNHMAKTGVCGIDLYILTEENQWVFIGTAQPNGKESRNVFLRNMEGKMHDYMAYLPLYDGVTKVEIGVDSSAVIEKPHSTILNRGSEKPIVFYGTSITQGGCATRPGMVYTSIISRARNQECINLGFSGNARMDKALAETLSRIDADQYVIDCLPNCTTQILKDSAYFFMTYLAKEHPDVPIFMVENVDYKYGFADLKTKGDTIEKNAYWKELYRKLRKEGYKNLIYIPEKDLSGDSECTVDGAHRTDLGFMVMAKGFMKYLKK
ncbi:MAG: SGNH/GDSL hydrolase family protein [Bacteroidales bacterium]|nr:SGNH/GDSL hydrolase family protein [Candidatus Cacconaster merdequi]